MSFVLTYRDVQPRLVLKDQQIIIIRPMEKQEETRMDTKPIMVGSKWLATKDCEGHKAGEVLEVAGENAFTTCSQHGQLGHGLDVFLRATVPLRDEAFWQRYAATPQVFSSALSPPQLGQVALWIGSEAWSLWLGVGGNGSLLLAKGGDARCNTATPVGKTKFDLSRGQWALVQDVGQAEPVALDKVGYKLANPPELACEDKLNKMGEAAGKSLNDEIKKAIDSYVVKGPFVASKTNKACTTIGCITAAVPGAKAQLCERHITEKQKEADNAAYSARHARPMEGYVVPWFREEEFRLGPHNIRRMPSSHAIAAGGIFDLHIPKPKKAWHYPEVDEYDLLPDA